MKHVTLVFLRRDNQILLAMKKRGFGVGKWNGAGGKVEPNETYEQAAIRECEEEVGVTPKQLGLAGELHFFDLPGVEHYCHIYVTSEWDGGEPHETEEMRPQWFSEESIPYGQMWPDDIFWLPLLLKGQLFKGRVVVEENQLKECTLEEVSSL
jgi:8-oxo-dGTP pyrophosphatase MutT (NUDIX family)